MPGGIRRVAEQCAQLMTVPGAQDNVESKLNPRSEHQVQRAPMQLIVEIEMAVHLGGDLEVSCGLAAHCTALISTHLHVFELQAEILKRILATVSPKALDADIVN